MSRTIVLSNGELAVALDKRGLVRDLYYPYVGLEDHARGHYIHRVGVWVDGAISWLLDDGWDISFASEEEALATSIVARHPRLQIELQFKDIVYNEQPILLRHITVINRADREREIKLYFGHQFEIYKAHGSDTAFYDPASHSVIHYKGRRVFLMSGLIDGAPMSDYATGQNGFNNQEGTHRDADDGVLSKNPIEHGKADSVIGFYAAYAPGQTHAVHYWIAAAQSIAEARARNGYIITKTPEHLERTASDFWKAWVNAYEWDFEGLSAEQIALFKRSLMFIRAHMDHDGGIIASLDSDMLQNGNDTYSYIWPRDAAFAALALDLAGDSNISRRFFEFCRDVVSDEGYFLHKFLPDKSFGSSWHPWIKDGVPQLPIQEDETALVLYALRAHYEKSRDLEFLENIFGPLVEKTADFMLQYRYATTRLPQPSYDLWERKRGTSTFTSSSVYGALVAAADLSKILGKREHEARYRQGAAEVRDAILSELWDDKNGMFLNMVDWEHEVKTSDATIDISSVYGLFAFDVLPTHDERLQHVWDKTVRALSQGIVSGGIARFENDDYFHSGAQSPGNPWILTTLWYAEFLIARAESAHDLDRVREIFTWVVCHALSSGALSEQLDPQTGEPIGATPLTWSHAAYVIAVLKYLERTKAILAR